MPSRWLSPSVFQWHASVEYAERVDARRHSRPYELLAHAERRLQNGPDEFAIADAVLSLKRAVNSRLKHLEELYGLSKAFPKSVGVLERLQAVDLARPLLVRQMFELRNDIEHNDAHAPNVDRSCELADATWYFLRATDSACSEDPKDLVFSPDAVRPMQAGAEFVSISGIKPGLPHVTVVARLRNEQISWTKLLGYLELTESPDFRERLVGVRTRSAMPAFDIDEHCYGEGEDQVHYGLLVLQDDDRQRLWSKLFGSARRNTAQTIFT